jgi:anthranilate phosphoribosyltransferase
MSGWDMSSQALTIASEIFLEKALPVRVPALDSSSLIKWIEDSDTEELEEGDGYSGPLDLVGTGGDGHDTFNVSTTAAIVAAGVPGVRVCKVSQI